MSKIDDFETIRKRNEANRARQERERLAKNHQLLASMGKQPADNLLGKMQEIETLINRINVLLSEIKRSLR